MQQRRTARPNLPTYDYHTTPGNTPTTTAPPTTSRQANLGTKPNTAGSKANQTYQTNHLPPALTPP